MNSVVKRSNTITVRSCHEIQS